MKTRKTVWIVGLSFWAIALISSLAIAMAWDFKPGPASAKLAPEQSNLHSMLLVVVLHSQCPCSRATVENLINLPEEVRAQLHLRLVFTGPDVRNSAIDVLSSALDKADRDYLSEQEVLTRYGAQTSGQAYLYGRNGHLLFSGGLTDSRGAAGESVGITAIEDAVAGRKTIASAPVFGCALQTSVKPS